MSPKNSADAALIISATGHAETLAIVLESVRRQTLPPSEIVMACSDRSDEAMRSGARLREAWPSMKWVGDAARTPHAAAVLNEAIRASTSRYVIFIASDCVPHRRFIEDHVRHSRSGSFVRGRRASVRARYVRSIRHARLRPLLWMAIRRIYGIRKGFRRPWPAVRSQDRRPIHAGNFAVWREDLIRVNGFNEAFDEDGDEFTELAERLLNAGVLARTVTGQAIVYHLDHPHLHRYGSNRSRLILEQTRREKKTVCEQGLLTPTVSVDVAPVVLAVEPGAATQTSAPHTTSIRNVADAV